MTDNEHIRLSPTAAGRIAVACVQLIRRMGINHERIPDIAEFEKELAPHLLREELSWRADEARSWHGTSLTERIASLERQREAIRYRDDF